MVTVMNSPGKDAHTLETSIPRSPSGSAACAGKEVAVRSKARKRTNRWMERTLI